MTLLVTDYLDRSAEKYPDKIAFVDKNRQITFQQLQKEAHHIGMGLIHKGLWKKPVAVFLDKSVECISAFLGAACSGNFYTPLDTKMPMARIEKIVETLDPAVILTDEAHKEAAISFAGGRPVVLYEESLQTPIDQEKLKDTLEKILDTDILYILFTSGSTGMPKGVIISQKALIDFIEWAACRFQMDHTYVIGNQTPFYFSMSVLDIYETLRNGATMYIIPHEKFSFPGMLMEYLYENNINTIYWVPSALTLLAAFNALGSPHLPQLKNVFFGGEVMPMKQLNKWIQEYPEARYVNFYGPTEVTDTCTAYEVNRRFENTEKLPMGTACRNMDVFLLDENNCLVTGTQIGEVCVRGTGLAYGYYNDLEKTREVFVQNPLQTCYPEIIYRTGDLAQRNEYGELVYISRKDFQIKHMGHRIELGEIEAAISSMEGIDTCCCLYDKEKSRILMYYTGTAKDTAVVEQLKSRLPAYMMPNKRVHLEEMPFNLNGKIDRQKLKELSVRKK